MKLYIKELQIETILGVYEYEKKKRFFNVNLEIVFDSGRAEFTDNLDDSLSYGDIERKIVAYVKDKDYNLIETLSKDILDAVFSFEKIQSCIVKVEKKKCTKYSESMIIENYRER